MKEEFEYAIDKLKDAINRLKEGVFEAKDDLDKDGVIQRFEFTFELLWKTLKIFLREKEGIECASPKGCLKEAFRLGLIENEKIFIDMLNDRNIASHTYNKVACEKIFNRIKNKYVDEIEKLLNKLK